jgi:hypothetical protein
MPAGRCCKQRTALRCNVTVSHLARVQKYDRVRALSSLEINDSFAIPYEVNQSPRVISQGLPVKILLKLRGIQHRQLSFTKTWCGTTGNEGFCRSQ